MLKYVWFCPVCHAYGKKLTAGHQAKKYGRRHLRRVHNIMNVEPNLAVIKTIRSIKRV